MVGGYFSPTIFGFSGKDHYAGIDLHDKKTEIC